MSKVVTASEISSLLAMFFEISSDEVRRYKTLDELCAHASVLSHDLASREIHGLIALAYIEREYKVRFPVESPGQKGLLDPYLKASYEELAEYVNNAE